MAPAGPSADLDGEGCERLNRSLLTLRLRGDWLLATTFEPLCPPCGAEGPLDLQAVLTPMGLP